MASRITVNPEQLNAMASDFSSQATALSNLTNEMLSLVGGISSAYTGEAATAFCNKFRQLDTDMTRLGNMVREYADDLTEIGMHYQEAENQNLEAAQSLSSEVIL